jgi:protein TonB
MLSRAARVPTAVLAAVLINILLFSAIQYMVGSQRIRLTDVSDYKVANFIRMRPQTHEVRSRRDPRAPEKPPVEQQETLRRLAQSSAPGPGVTDLRIDVPEMEIEVGVDIGDIHIARELTPLVKIPPEYPQRAMAKEIEGYVVLRFIVTETGSVEAPEILHAEPEGYFETAAMRAVLRWKYQPQFRNGKPIRAISITRIIFAFEKEPQG